MERDNYYNQSQIIKLFNVSLKKYKDIVLKHQLQPIEKVIELRTNEGVPYLVTTQYLQKEIIETILLSEGINKR